MSDAAVSDKQAKDWQVAKEQETTSHGFRNKIHCETTHDNSWQLNRRYIY